MGIHVAFNDGEFLPIGVKKAEGWFVDGCLADNLIYHVPQLYNHKHEPIHDFTSMTSEMCRLSMPVWTFQECCKFHERINKFDINLQP
jgi:hypothetical protein